MPQVSSAGEALVLIGTQQGFTVIPSRTRLTRLHYFDGKFLRAADLETEQRYLRALVELSNQAGEVGVVYGFDTVLAAGGDKVQIGPGLAIDPAGRTLLLPNLAEVALDVLIEASRRTALAGGTPAGPASLPMDLPRPFGFGVAPGARPAIRLRRPEIDRLSVDAFGECEMAAGTPPSDVSSGNDLYLLTIGHAEAYCGHEDVYGRLCEEACVTSSDRPYVVEGLVVRVIPLVLRTAPATSRVVALDRRHQRSLVASAFYADERLRVGSLISKAGLSSNTWCLGADLAGGADVPLAVVARSGSVTVFLDAWTARRERMEAPSRRYWAWRMAMRPWSVYLAQILQFQCQLHELFQNVPESGGEDPCRDHAVALGDAVTLLEKLEKASAPAPAPAPAPAGPAGRIGSIEAIAMPVAALGGAPNLAAMKARFLSILKDAGQPRDRILIRGGIVELPSAGYLPVTPAAAENVNSQVRALMGEGVDLRFCVVRPDFVPHALEEAQHMERISLLEGLDNPDRKPEVDILVPDGQILRAPEVTGTGFEATVTLNARKPQAAGPVPVPAPAPESAPGALEAGRFVGAARGEQLSTGGGTFHLAASGSTSLAGIATLGPLLKIVTQGGAVPPAAPAFIEPIMTTAFTLIEFRSLPAFLWLTMRSERDPFALAANQSMPVSLEAVFQISIGKVATRVAIQSLLIRLLVSGPFTVTASQRLVAGPKVTGSFSGHGSYVVMGFVSSGSRVSDSAHIEAKSLKLSGDRHTGKLTAELSQDVSGITVGYSINVEWDDTAAGQGPQASFTATLTDARGAEVPGMPDPLFSLNLDQSSEIFKIDNPNHGFAVTAIDQIAAALANADPPFSPEEAKKRLFTTPAASPGDIAVRATRDWVLFHRRRTKDCATPVEKPVEPPVQTTCQTIYRLDPASRALLLRLIATDKLTELLALRDRVSAVGQLDFKLDSADIVDGRAEVGAAWTTAGAGAPEAIFVFSKKGDAAAGVASLRAARAKALADLLPDGSADPNLRLEMHEIEPAVPGGCPVVVLVLPKPAVVTRKALLIYTNWDRPNHFIPNHPAPFATLEFKNDVPQANELTTFINSLTANQPVRGVTLATTMAPPDAGAPNRLKAVIDALAAAGRPAIAATRQVVQPLNDHDRAELTRDGQNPNNFDEVIFFELNPGA